MSTYKSIVQNLKNNWKIYLIAVPALIISCVAVYYATRTEKPYTETLYSDVLNQATFKIGNKHEILYSYPLNSGQGTSSGFFTVTVTTPSSVEIPNITFDVKDDLDRPLLSDKVRVGKITKIYFRGKEGSKVIRLFAYPKSDNINLTTISISLNR